ncbi:MAG: coproporphyrinogen dehydrogenase HemZ [Bacillota bacterium]|nr:coproporphyrinogen dehydrogenase HemZ [Bacillota bacterium]
MRIECNGHSYRNLIESVSLLFYPVSSFEGDEGDGRGVVSTLKVEQNMAYAHTLLYDGPQSAEYECNEKVKEDGDYQVLIGKSVFLAWQRLCNITPPWGTLIGIRPAKVASRLLSEGYTDQEIINFFQDNYFTRQDKASVCIEAAKLEKNALGLLKPDMFSLYVSIPFCPSRCSYCSFVSHSIEKAKKLIDPYVDLLCRELALWGEAARGRSMRPLTIYFGGGTPTTLSGQQLLRIMNTIKDSFDLTSLQEYTVEAGRPDTITKEKLEAIKIGGAGRISINPQTMSDNTLAAIGRRHTSDDIRTAFKIARSVGFDTINADLIAGLPGEGIEDFSHTLKGILDLSPENITVHTLSIKKSAFLKENGGDLLSKQAAVTGEMVSLASEVLRKENYHPYYLYRQKNTAGNHENVGYAKDGHDGLYNIYTMGEHQSILAAGAGAVTKIVKMPENRIERFFEYKYPYEYINNFEKAENNIKQAMRLI